MASRDPQQRENPVNREDQGYSWVRWPIFLLVASVAMLYVIGWLSGTSRLEISYSQFVEQVQSDRVSKVTLKRQQATGEFTTPMRLSGDHLVTADRTGDDINRDFKTTIPAAGEQDLIALLQEHDVGITAEPDEDGWSTWISTLIVVLPILLIVGIFWYLNRAVGRGAAGQNLVGFVRSRARIYDEKRPSVTFDDVAGEDEAKAELSQCVDFLRNPDKYHEIGARLPRGVLLVGPPGTGKTLLARAVAGEASVPFFSVSASEFVEMFVGVGAGRVRDLFERAKALAPSIVFIDELDAVGRQRFAGIGGSNDEREQTLNQLLVEMDGFEPHDEVIVMSATNRPDVLDPALLRPGRFDWHVELGLPDRSGRLAILRIHARKLAIDVAVDLEPFAAITPGFSGADLANLVNQAALIAARHDKKIVEQSDFEEALDKIILGAERPLLLTDHEKRMLAYHEAGHAVVARFTQGADPLRKVSIVPRGRALGMTLQTPATERYTHTDEYLLGRLAVMMGGRAAEQLIFNQLTTGAENDLKEATLLARQMVGLWGMSEEIGPYFLGTGEQHVFLGREITRSHNLSDILLSQAEAATRSLLEQSQQRARSVLDEHRRELDQLAARLVEIETVDAEELVEILIRSESAAPRAVASANDR